MVNRPSHIRSNYEGYSERMKVRKERRAKMVHYNIRILKLMIPIFQPHVQSSIFCTPDDNIRKICTYKFFAFFKDINSILFNFSKRVSLTFRMTLFLFLQLIEAKRSPRLFQNSDNIQIIGKVEKKTFFENESFKIVKAMSLALSILTLCYYGCTEYNILHNGQILRFPSRKTVVTFSFGYSVNHSIISAVATSSMLVYSIIMVNRIIK